MRATKSEVKSPIHILRSNAGWYGKREGATYKIRQPYATYPVAVSAHREIAKTDETALIIHRPGGQIAKNELYYNNKPTELTGKSVLRYPGGKTRALVEIVSYFPQDIKELCSPFFGGGSIEIYMASKGIKVYGYDIFEPVANFWSVLNTEPKALADKVSKFLPLSKARFYELQSEQNEVDTKKSALVRAAEFYVLNRSSFSGSTLSGGMSPKHPRFNQASIDRIRGFYNPNFSVERVSFEQSIERHAKTFKYLDPPYLIALSLYGNKGNTHRNFDHSGLAAILHKTDNWILSYNDCKEIREMYKGYQIITPSWAYGMSKDKSSKEVLIFSHDIKIAKEPLIVCQIETSKQSNVS
jgi:DNA adenine methylase